MKHLREFASFYQEEIFYYHFSPVNLNPGDIITSSICEDPVYLDIVMPIYRREAKKHGFDWPVVHGYCFDSPNWITTSSSFSRESLKDYKCYKAVARGLVHEGAVDRSSQYATMLLHHGTITEEEIAGYAHQYFMPPPTSYKESICGSFQVIDVLNDGDWEIKQWDT